MQQPMVIKKGFAAPIIRGKSEGIEWKKAMECMNEARDRPSKNVLKVQGHCYSCRLITPSVHVYQNTTKVDGLGGEVWPGAILLAQFLVENASRLFRTNTFSANSSSYAIASTAQADDIRSTPESTKAKMKPRKNKRPSRGVSAVELGAGCGLTGFIAAACGASHVVLTDEYPELLNFNHAFITQTQSHPLIPASAVTIRRLIWDDRDDEEALLHELESIFTGENEKENNRRWSNLHENSKPHPSKDTTDSIEEKNENENTEKVDDEEVDQDEVDKHEVDVDVDAKDSCSFDLVLGAEVTQLGRKLHRPLLATTSRLMHASNGVALFSMDLCSSTCLGDCHVGKCTASHFVSVARNEFQMSVYKHESVALMSNLHIQEKIGALGESTLHQGLLDSDDFASVFELRCGRRACAVPSQYKQFDSNNS